MMTTQQIAERMAETAAGASWRGLPGLERRAAAQRMLAALNTALSNELLSIGPAMMRQPQKTNAAIFVDSTSDEVLGAVFFDDRLSVDLYAASCDIIETTRGCGPLAELVAKARADG